VTESSVLCGLDEISAYTGLSKRQTREAVTSGAIPGRLIAGRWTSTKAAVDGAVELGRIPGRGGRLKG
jgi:hypothetical protein